MIRSDTRSSVKAMAYSERNSLAEEIADWAAADLPGSVIWRGDLSDCLFDARVRRSDAKRAERLYQLYAGSMIAHLLSEIAARDATPLRPLEAEA